MYYFVDKCLPFGAAISCSHFQRFSDAVAHIISTRTGRKLVNYLDNYLFIALLKLLCNTQVREFLWVCEHIQFPVSLEKTFWVTTQLMFLGLLIDTIAQTVSLPHNKIIKTLQIISQILNSKSWKVTVKQLQRLCSMLNFVCRAVVPGRAFTRRLYAHTAGQSLKPHHHICINQELKFDLMV